MTTRNTFGETTDAVLAYALSDGPLAAYRRARHPTWVRSDEVVLDRAFREVAQVFEEFSDRRQFGGAVHRQYATPVILQSTRDLKTAASPYGRFLL